MASERRIATLTEQMRWLHTCPDPECNGLHDCAGGAIGGGVATAAAAGDDHEALEEGAVLDRTPRARPAVTAPPRPLLPESCPSRSAAAAARDTLACLRLSLSLIGWLLGSAWRRSGL